MSSATSAPAATRRHHRLVRAHQEQRPGAARCGPDPAGHAQGTPTSAVLLPDGDGPTLIRREHESLLRIPGETDPELAAELEDAVWTRMQYASHLRAQRLGGSRSARTCTARNAGAGPDPAALPPGLDSGRDRGRHRSARPASAERDRRGFGLHELTSVARQATTRLLDLVAVRARESLTSEGDRTDSVKASAAPGAGADRGADHVPRALRQPPAWANGLQQADFELQGDRLAGLQGDPQPTPAALLMAPFDPRVSIGGRSWWELR